MPSRRTPTQRLASLASDSSACPCTARASQRSQSLAPVTWCMGPRPHHHEPDGWVVRAGMSGSLRCRQTRDVDREVGVLHARVTQLAGTVGAPAFDPLADASARVDVARANRIHARCEARDVDGYEAVECGRTVAELV